MNIARITNVGGGGSTNDDDDEDDSSSFDYTTPSYADRGEPDSSSTSTYSNRNEDDEEEPTSTESDSRPDRAKSSDERESRGPIASTMPVELSDSRPDRAKSSSERDDPVIQDGGKTKDELADELYEEPGVGGSDPTTTGVTDSDGNDWRDTDRGEDLVDDWENEPTATTMPVDEEDVEDRWADWGRQNVTSEDSGAPWQADAADMSQEEIEENTAAGPDKDEMPEYDPDFWEDEEDDPDIPWTRIAAAIAGVGLLLLWGGS